jgi:hypothetical protein
VTELVPQSRSLELLSNAKLAVAEARTIDEAKNLRDSAEALRVYAKQAGESLAIQNECAEVKLRAERKAGEILAATPKNEGGRPSENRSRAVTGSAPKLEELGVTKMQSHRWQQVASVDEADFEAHVESVKERGDELTTASVVARQGARPHRPQGREARPLRSARRFPRARRGRPLLRALRGSAVALRGELDARHALDREPLPDHERRRARGAGDPGG